MGNSLGVGGRLQYMTETRLLLFCLFCLICWWYCSFRALVRLTIHLPMSVVFCEECFSLSRNLWPGSCILYPRSTSHSQYTLWVS